MLVSTDRQLTIYPDWRSAAQRKVPKKGPVTPLFESYRAKTPCWRHRRHHVGSQSTETANRTIQTRCGWRGCYPNRLSDETTHFVSK
jgi:hypothetical protein